MNAFSSQGPGLLVSVRSAAEAAAALAGGAALIDVKEPRRGALGAPDAETLRQVVDEVRGRVPVSAALGELEERRSEQGENRGIGGAALPPEVALAKLGLAGCGPQPDWGRRWREAMQRLSTRTTPVAVVYADWATCRAPEPDEVLGETRGSGGRFLLLDTFDKQRGSLVELWKPEELSKFAARVERAGLKLVLGGSLHVGHLARLLPLRPAFVAVRTAVCRGGRAGTVDAALVRELADRLALRPQGKNS